MTFDIMRRVARKTLHLWDRSARKAAVSADAFALQKGLIGSPEPVILDIGAHIGRVTAVYRKLFPLATIHCFEPFPESFRSLSARVKGDSRTFCHEIAVSAKNGRATLNANISPGTNSLLATHERAASYWGKGLLETTRQVEVNTTTVDAFCLEAGIPHIDILKMDAQGSEFSVLEGARNMLTQQSIALIYTEILIGPAYKGQHKLHEYLSFLDSFGYCLLDFFNAVRYRKRLVQVDAVFLSPSISPDSPGPAS